MILLAEPPLQAEIMMSSSMMVSLTLGLPDCTTNTSFSRTLVRMRTLVSPLENWPSSASARAMPRLWHILSVSSGQELPAKIKVPRIVSAVFGGGMEVVRRNFGKFSANPSIKSGYRWAAQDFSLQGGKTRCRVRWGQDCVGDGMYVRSTVTVEAV